MNFFDRLVLWPFGENYVIANGAIFTLIACAAIFAILLALTVITRLVWSLL
jgi:hypothetical protein